MGVLLWDIYQRTGFYYDVQLMPDGAKRKGAQARRRERMLFGITMFFACVLLFYRPRETFSITALDVGQGDSLVVESGRFVMLNDGGSSSASAIGEKRILPYLKQRGIAALDAVVVTHPDADHTNGILELLELIGRIEQEQKRERIVHWGPRTVDLDIILYDQEIIQTKDLMIPHVEMANRMFVLEPMCEIAPYAKNPLNGCCMLELKEQLQRKEMDS